MLLKVILLAFIFSKALAFLEELPSEQEIEAEWEFEFDCTDKPSRSMHAIGCSPFYWWCYRGTGERISCEDNKFFNPEIEECDLRENVPACNAQSTPVEVAKAKVLTEETTASTLAVDCSNLPDGNYLDPSQTCSNTYTSCANGMPHVHPCPAWLYFNKDIGLCDARENIPACNIPLGAVDPVEPIETAAIIESARVEAPEAVVTSGQSDGFDCSALPDGNYADPMHPCANTFITCDNQVAHSRPCPPFGLYYDQASDACKRKEEVPACVEEPKVSAPPPRQSNFIEIKETPQATCTADKCPSDDVENKPVAAMEEEPAPPPAAMEEAPAPPAKVAFTSSKASSELASFMMVLLIAVFAGFYWK